MNLVAAGLPDEYAHRTLQFVAKQLEQTQHVQFYMQWACRLLTVHGPKEELLSAHTLLTLHQNISRKYEQLSKVCDFNKYTMRVLRSVEEPKKEADDGDADSDEELEDADEELLLGRPAAERTEEESDDSDDGDDDEGDEDDDDEMESDE